MSTEIDRQWTTRLRKTVVEKLPPDKLLPDTQPKDGINATGGGAIFNVLNLGQMLMWHIVLLPLAAVALTAVHVIYVRIKGVVPPFDEVK